MYTITSLSERLSPGVASCRLQADSQPTPVEMCPLRVRWPLWTAGFQRWEHREQDLSHLESWQMCTTVVRLKQVNSIVRNNNHTEFASHLVLLQRISHPSFLPVLHFVSFILGLVWWVDLSLQWGRLFPICSKVTTHNTLHTDDVINIDRYKQCWLLATRTHS